MKLLIISTVLFVSAPVTTIGQEFNKQKLGKEDISNGVLARYTIESFENAVQLTLFKNHLFVYRYKSTGFDQFSQGKWRRNRNFLILTSNVDSNNVSTKCLLLESDTIRTYFERHKYSDTNPPVYTTPVQVPINLKGELIPDAKVYINNDTTYCFPFFDTCVGGFRMIQRIRVHYGEGFKSKWIRINNSGFKRLLCIAQVDIEFNNYISFKNHRLKIEGDKLKSIDVL